MIHCVPDEKCACYAEKTDTVMVVIVNFAALFEHLYNGCIHRRELSGFKPTMPKVLQVFLRRVRPPHLKILYKSTGPRVNV